MANYTDVAKIKDALAQLRASRDGDDPDFDGLLPQIEDALAEPFDRDSQVMWLAQVLRISGIGAVVDYDAAAADLYRRGVRVSERDDVPPEVETS